MKDAYFNSLSKPYFYSTRCNAFKLIQCLTTGDMRNTYFRCLFYADSQVPGNVVLGSWYRLPAEEPVEYR
jgi:hypothetical protein